MENVVTVATWYALQYIGQPLYCGGTYAEAAAPWVAMPAGGDWQCGDLVYLSFGNGDALMARAMDAGPFGDNCVMQGDTCAPIVTDVPRHLWPVSLEGDTSATVTLWNVTGDCRARGLCD